ALQVTGTGRRLFPMTGLCFCSSCLPIGGNISLEGFLLPILLLVVIIVMVVVILIVVVAIIGIVVVVVILLACSIPIGWTYAFHQDKASLVRVPVTNVTLSSLADLLRENTDLVRLNQQMSPIAPTMSSPDHSTSNNEDAFSSNISDYVSTIMDYSPASLGKTYSNASI
nr:hypothetical protein [Tanacetum cinerariifolium]